MLDPRLHSLVRALRDRVPGPGSSLAERRAALLQAVTDMPVASGVTVTPVSHLGVGGEVATPDRIVVPEAHVLYFPGGGYVMGSEQTARVTASHLAQQIGCPVTAAGYRRAPQHPFPAAVEDAVHAYRRLVHGGQDPRRLVVAGESAGGGLALAALVALRDAGAQLPAAAVCLSPWADLTLTAPSLTTNAEFDPQAPMWLLQEAAADYLGGADAHDPLASPVFADLRGLPPLLIEAGGAESLLDDSVRLSGAAARAGVDVTLHVWPGMIHVWPAFAPRLEPAMSAHEEIAAWVRSQLDGITT